MSKSSCRKSPRPNPWPSASESAAFRSAPAQKTLSPEPVMVMTRAARVSTAFLKPSRIPLRTAGFRAFRCSGRLIVILATPCSTEYKTSLINSTFGEKYHFGGQTSPTFTDGTTDEHRPAQPQPKNLTAEGEDASWERAHLACSVNNRETVSTLPACPGVQHPARRMRALPGARRRKILGSSQRIFGLVVQICVYPCSSVVHSQFWLRLRAEKQREARVPRSWYSHACDEHSAGCMDCTRICRPAGI